MLAILFRPQCGNKITFLSAIVCWFPRPGCTHPGVVHALVSCYDLFAAELSALFGTGGMVAPNQPLAPPLVSSSAPGPLPMAGTVLDDDLSLLGECVAPGTGPCVVNMGQGPDLI